MRSTSADELEMRLALTFSAEVPSLSTLLAMHTDMWQIHYLRQRRLGRTKLLFVVVRNMYTPSGFQGPGYETLCYLTNCYRIDTGGKLQPHALHLAGALTYCSLHRFPE